MSSQPEVALILAKEDFKFSSAHFTIFGDASAELLHGHNYQVSVRLVGSSLDRLGFLVDLAEVKRFIRGHCARLDERVLVPQLCSHLRVAEEDGETELAYNQRRYRFPAADVLLLPLSNITIEELAHYLWRLLAEDLPQDRIERLEVTVGETSGQKATWSARLPSQQAR
jgi:6-pyruvoyltetrahydropterin/6-carboxytetrahydropterin synthase